MLNFEIEESYSPRYPQAATMTDKDVRRIKAVFDKAQKISDDFIIIKLSDKVASQLNIQVEQSPQTFIQTLLKDYHYYSTR
jgi:hypothetical protein